jgi:hypothetical protein
LLAAGIHLVGQTGNQAPGTPAGVVFSLIRDALVNNANQIAFAASVSGRGVTQFSQNYVGIWAQDTPGVLHKIARDGDQIDVDDGPGILRKNILDLCLSAQWARTSKECSQ